MIHGVAGTPGRARRLPLMAYKGVSAAGIGQMLGRCPHVPSPTSDWLIRCLINRDAYILSMQTVQ